MAGLRPSTRALAVIGAVLLSPMLNVAGAQETCFEEGKTWQESPTTDTIPNAGYFHTPAYCQTACQSRGPYCLHWVWKATGNFSMGIGNGGCWVVGNNATQMEVNASIVGRVVSGSQECPPETSTTIPVATLPPMTSLVPTTNITNSTNGTFVVPEEEGAGGFPWWAILLVIVGLIGLGGAVMYYGNCAEGSSKKKSSKKKKTSSRRKTEDIEAVPVQEMAATEVTAPLIQPAAAETAVAEPVAVAASPGVQYATTAPTAVAAPMTGYASMPQPMQYVQPGGSVVMTQSPMASVRQPQFVSMR